MAFLHSQHNVHLWSYQGLRFGWNNISAYSHLVTEHCRRCNRYGGVDWVFPHLSFISTKSLTALWCPLSFLHLQYAYFSPYKGHSYQAKPIILPNTDCPLSFKASTVCMEMSEKCTHNLHIPLRSLWHSWTMVDGLSSPSNYCLLMELGGLDLAGWEHFSL